MSHPDTFELDSICKVDKRPSKQYLKPLIRGGSGFGFGSTFSFSATLRPDTADRTDVDTQSKYGGAFTPQSHDCSTRNLLGSRMGDGNPDEFEQSIRDLTKRFSLHAGNAFASDPNLDPNNPSFDAKTWINSLMHLQTRDLNKFPTRATGVSIKNLSVHGFISVTDYQKTIGTMLHDLVGMVRNIYGGGKRRVDILHGIDGLIRSGEMLLVLGPPGSGCSTFLKTIAGETYGFNVGEDSNINYQGISSKQMHGMFRGEAIYTAEQDVHFPMLTVNETLLLAARARAPRYMHPDVNGQAYAEHMRDIVMATLGISHTAHTKIGNDLERGISGGERKRVSVAEAVLSQAPIQCWDNSTRGLDSANSLSFCKTLRTSTDILGATVFMALYQTSEAAYELFDKVTILYEGRQIFFGRCSEAKEYFTSMGFQCPDRQTTADFLTSLTSPSERIVRSGYEGKTPETPDEFAKRWRASDQHAQLSTEIERFNNEHYKGSSHVAKFISSRAADKSRMQRSKSPYTLSYPQQVKLCLWRGFLRLKRDPSLTVTQLVGNLIMALVIGSVFYNLPSTTGSFYQRGALLFFSILLNAFGSALEILTLYAQRPIVEKHARYAFYHPSSEAISSVLIDMPYKIMNTIVFNLTLYFMSNLRREVGPFFFFLLLSFILTMTMSMLFRTIASTSRTLGQAMTPAAILILGIVLFTGFAVPIRDMPGWCRWMTKIDPIAYAFESLMINEFQGRSFRCSNWVPDGPVYSTVPRQHRICGALSAEAGSDVVSGDRYITSAFRYDPARKWINVYIVLGFLALFTCTYLLSSEFIPAKKSKGEVLLFRRVRENKAVTDDPESSQLKRDAIHEPSMEFIPKAKNLQNAATFHWEDLTYNVKVENDMKRILDKVDGWVKPGTLTALMGVSGAGKTTLLDVLAHRIRTGVADGEVMIDGAQRDDSFQRQIGYVQQQDIHLPTTTVREALRFSAMLRQNEMRSKELKLAEVDRIIEMLGMGSYAEAIVGVPGEGLNIEQRKRLTIAVELAARPDLLLFLDEPTSGLDSQTAWVICDLIEQLSKNGQAILCTIHQPSAILFQRFDRVLLLGKGGGTLYFGEIGANSSVIIDYFERNGAKACPTDANPAEWILEVTGAAPGVTTMIDWPRIWKDSPEYILMKCELSKIRDKAANSSPRTGSLAQGSEFAVPFSYQIDEVTRRVFQQYWRTPGYIYAKTAVCIFSSLFIGFVFFRAKNSQQGLQNQMFAVFMLLTIFGQLTQQLMPQFVRQRTLYESRERQSKTYSWKVFMMANILVEIPWSILMSFFVFFCWFYPIGLWRNAEPTNSVYERSELMFLLILTFMLFTCTFSHMIIAAIDAAEEGSSLANVLFSFALMFCGVLVTPAQMPRFWIFMYHISPFTYLVSAMLSTAVADTRVVCAENEYHSFPPPAGTTCAQYLRSFMRFTGGYLKDPLSTTNCNFCPIGDTNIFLAGLSSHLSQAWRNFGIMWIYIFFNIGAAFGLYWLFRVKKSQKRKEE